MTRNHPLLRSAVVLAAVVFLAASWVSRAEVGVYEMALGSGPYELKIIEDPDPVGLSWRAIHPPNSGYVVLNPQGEVNGDGPPSMLLHPTTSIPIVAWSRAASGGYDVVVSRFESGAWTVVLNHTLPSPSVLNSNGATAMGTVAESLISQLAFLKNCKV